MHIAVCFIGESFRFGGQTSREVNSSSAYTEQMKAIESHVMFVNNLCNKDHTVSLFLHTYSTRFDEDMLNAYKNKTICGLRDYKLLSYQNLETDSINCHLKRSIQILTTHGLLDTSTSDLDLAMFIRIDLYLKPYFLIKVNPEQIDKITYPSICFIQNNCQLSYDKPRVNDMMIFVPKKYFYFIYSLNLDHDSWLRNVRHSGLQDNDMTCLLNTYHDSDSAKDWNPLYYIVNRTIFPTWYSKDYMYTSVTDVFHPKKTTKFDDEYKCVAIIHEREKYKNAVRVIAHRGNTQGPDKRENEPQYIIDTIELGYDVEVDVWYNDKEEAYYLGHDKPQYIVNLQYLKDISSRAYFHAKNIDALSKLTGLGFHVFYHDKDDYTLTSKGLIWAYPCKPAPKPDFITLCLG